MRPTAAFAIKNAGKAGTGRYRAGMRPVGVALVLMCTLLSGPGAWAATPTETLQEVFARADRILTNPETEDRPLERLLAVRRLVNDALDFRETAALALGRRWRTATPAQQREFTQLLADLLERSYISRLAAQASLAGGPQVEYLEESVEGGEAFVWTTIARRSGGHILLGYRMIDRDGRWKVRDVVVDGVSVAANYRAQIERFLEVSSMADLLAHMRDKVSSGAEVAEIADDMPVIAVPVVKLHETLDIPPATETSRADARPAEETPIRTVSVDEGAVRSTARPLEPPVVRALDPPAVRARPRVTRAYWLRLGTVQAIEESGRLAALLDERNLVVGVEPAGIGGEPPPLSVRVGPFQDATEAVLKLLDLQTKGHDPVLVAERE